MARHFHREISNMAFSHHCGKCLKIRTFRCRPLAFEQLCTYPSFHRANEAAFSPSKHPNLVQQGCCRCLAVGSSDADAKHVPHWFSVEPSRQCAGGSSRILNYEYG